VFVVNSLEGAISGKETVEDLQYNIESRSPETEGLTVIQH